MKRILTTTALIAGAFGATTAMASSDDMMRTQVLDRLEIYAVEVNEAALTEEQVDELYAVISSGGMPGEQLAKIEAVLIDTPAHVETEGFDITVDAMPVRQQEEYVAQGLENLALADDYSAEEMDVQQLDRAYAILNGPDSAAEQRAKIKSMFN